MFFVSFPFRLRSFLSSRTRLPFSLFYRLKLVIQLTSHFLAFCFIRCCLTGRGQKAKLLEPLWKRHGTYGSGMGPMEAAWDLWKRHGTYGSGMGPTEALWEGYGRAMEAVWERYGSGMGAVWDGYETAIEAVWERYGTYGTARITARITVRGTARIAARNC